jgi:hypothetical protein
MKQNSAFLHGTKLNSYITLALIFVVFGFKPLCAQEMLGIVNSSYAGITGSVINPAVSVTSPFYIDINIASGDLFFENNFLYLSKEEYRFKRFLSKNPDFPTHGPDNLIAYDYNTRQDKKAYVNLRLLGPSLAITVGRHSFGFVTGARAVMSVKNVPYEMAKFALYKLEVPSQYDINYIDNRNIYNAELGWMENGINYSYVFKQKNLDYWAAGITIKDLRGYGGGYMYTENADYIIMDRDTLIVHNVNGQGGYSLPVDYQNNDYQQNPLFRGKGIGIDLGVIYQKKKSFVSDYPSDKLCDQNYVPYKYKICISLLDIGRIRFTQNAEKLVLNNASTYWPGITYTEFTTFRDLTNLISDQFYGDTSQLYAGNEIKVALPTALSIQTDLNFYKNMYINGTIVYPVQFSKSGLIRPVLFAVTPRFQTAVFEASLPITLYDWTKPRIGLSARFMVFYIGTEKLSGYFHFTDFTGIDFYAGLKISLKKGSCRNKNQNGNCGYDEYKKFIKYDKK